MGRVKEVEYCDFKMTLPKHHLFDIVESTVGTMYSSVENTGYMIVYVYLENGVAKLKFKKHHTHVTLMGKVYCFQNDKLHELMENLLYHGKGHAIIKRFGEKAIYIETVVFGEIVSIVEVVGSTKKVLYKKKQIISTEDLERLWESTAAESRIRTLDLETNYALAWLAEALEKRDVVLIETYKRVLKELHKQRLMLEI